MENILLAGDYTICFPFPWHVLLIMLQEANPKFYEEQLMMAKLRIELGDHGPGGAAVSSMFGKELGSWLIPGQHRPL